jgi:hypothetical protein
VIEAMVRNVFMRSELLELSVTLRVGGGEVRAAGDDEEEGEGEASGDGGAYVLNFVRDDAMAGHRPKEVGAVFRYGLTEAGVERRASLHGSRGVAAAKLGDAFKAAAEFDLAHRLRRPDEGGEVSGELLGSSLRAWASAEALPRGVELSYSSAADAYPLLLVFWFDDEAAVSLAFEYGKGGRVVRALDDAASLDEIAALLGSMRAWVAEGKGGRDYESATALFELLGLEDVDAIGAVGSLILICDDPDGAILPSMSLLMLGPDRRLSMIETDTTSRVFAYECVLSEWEGRFQKD